MGVREGCRKWQQQATGLEAHTQHIGLSQKAARGTNRGGREGVREEEDLHGEDSIGCMAPSPCQFTTFGTRIPSYFRAFFLDQDKYPSWFILDHYVRFDNCDNATTAEAKTSTGRTIKFTFCLDPPPAVSHLFVHETNTHSAVQAEVVSYAKDLVLLLRNANEEVEKDEYFVYQAAGGLGRSKPSLTSIPGFPANLNTLSSCAAILPLDDGHFLLADLTVDFTDVEYNYHLHVFSSKTCVWGTRTLPLPTRRDDVLDKPDKVIALGGSVLGWVVSRDPVHTRFIPLPKPDWGPEEEWEGSLLHFRDVAYCGDAFIKLLDMDLRFRYVTVDRNHRPVTKMAKDLDHVDTILDSELLPPEDI
ncbi:hypothetical protein ACQ4PT_042082 [Festuca glaucescens]